MKIWNVSLVAVCLGLSACGFHLKGWDAPVKDLPMERLFFEGQGVIVDGLKSRILRDYPNTKIVEAPDNGVWQIKALRETKNKDVLTINPAGRANTYALTLRVNALAQSEAMNEQGIPLDAVIRRELSYKDSELLAKQYEEELIWKDMQKEAVELLIRKLSAIKNVAK